MKCWLEMQDHTGESGNDITSNNLRNQHFPRLATSRLFEVFLDIHVLPQYVFVYEAPQARRFVHWESVAWLIQSRVHVSGC
jgi:hypothetical protein